MDQQKVLIFLHQLRTAGLSTWAVLQEEFGAGNVFKLGEVSKDVYHSYEDFKKAAAKDAHQVYAGHFFYGAHRHIPRQCEYFTTLRDPVERLLSLYQVSRALGRAGGDCAKWLKSDFESHNGMVKRLIGVGRMEHDAEVYDFVNDKLASPAMTVGEDEYRQALSVLEKHFPCVLLHGCFVENMVLLQTHYGTGPLFSLNRQFLNHAKTPTLRENYPAEIIAQIESQNRYDIRLYEDYKGRFHRRLEQGGDAMRKEIEIMDIVSSIVTEEKEQVVETARVMERMQAAIETLFKVGRGGDAVQTLKRFSSKFSTQEAFGLDVLSFIRNHGEREDLEDEVEKFKARFGETDSLKAFLK